VIYSHKEIIEKCKILGAKISNDFRDAKLVTMVGLLKGAMPFMAELIKHIDIEVRIDFITATSYTNGNQKSDELKMVMDLSHSVKDHDVIIVEDICESGLTLTKIVEHLGHKNPNSISTCVLVDKTTGREHPFDVDYYGFKNSEAFLVGFGFDDDGYLRNLPFIAEVA